MEHRTTLFERMRRGLAQRIARPEFEAIKGAEETLLEMYRLGPAMFTPEMAVAALKESGDAQLYDFLYDTLLNWDVLNMTARFSNQSRTRAVEESRRLYARDVVSNHIVELWTDFGFGMNIEVTPLEDKYIEFWTEFWDAPRNSCVLGQRNIHELSERILTDGEIFFVFFTSTVDGVTTVRTIMTEEITELIGTPDDDGQTVFYKREYTPKGKASNEVVYYTDWRIDKGSPEYNNSKDAIKKKDSKAKFADEQGDEKRTSVKMLMAARNQMGGRGWPLLTSSAPWARTYKQFLEDRASVARAVAMYVDKIDVKGGQRAVDYVINRLQSGLVEGNNYYDNNPRPTAGSSWVQNEAIDRTRQSLSTGAGDAQKDGAMLIGQALLGGGLFPHYAGFGDAYRLATATAMELPVLKRMQRYQTFWSSVWSDMATIVLMQGIEYSKLKESKSGTEVHVSMDSIILEDLQQVNQVVTMLNSWVEMGGNYTGSKEAIQHILEKVLQQLGLKNAAEILTQPDMDMPDEPEMPDAGLPDQEPEEEPNTEEGDFRELAGSNQNVKMSSNKSK